MHSPTANPKASVDLLGDDIRAAVLFRLHLLEGRGGEGLALDDITVYTDEAEERPECNRRTEITLPPALRAVLTCTKRPCCAKGA